MSWSVIGIVLLPFRYSENVEMPKEYNRSHWEPKDSELFATILYKLWRDFPESTRWKDLLEEVQIERPKISRTTFKIYLDYLVKLHLINENRISRKNVQYTLYVPDENKEVMIALAKGWKQLEADAKEHSRLTGRISKEIFMGKPLTNNQVKTFVEYVLHSYDLCFRKALQLILESQESKEAWDFMGKYLTTIVIKTPLEQAVNLLLACFRQYPKLIMTILEEEAIYKQKTISSKKHKRNLDSLAKKYVEYKISKKID